MSKKSKERTQPHRGSPSRPARVASDRSEDAADKRAEAARKLLTYHFISLGPRGLPPDPARPKWEYQTGVIANTQYWLTVAYFFAKGQSAPAERGYVLF